MKSEDLKWTVKKTKYENSDEPAKNDRAFARVLSLQIIKLWIKMVRINTGSINLSSPFCSPRTTLTKTNISKTNHRQHPKPVSIRRLAAGMNVSKSSIRQISCKDLGCFPGKKMEQSKLKNLQNGYSIITLWIILYSSCFEMKNSLI